MNNLTGILNSGGQKFIEFAAPMLIQSSVLIVILLAVDLLLRNKVRATFRYWLWMLVLVKLVLPPTFSSPVSFGRIFGEKIAAPLTKSAAIVETYTPAEPLIIKPLENSGQEKVIATQTRSPAEAPVAVSAAGAAYKTGGGALSWQAIVLVVWAGAAGAMAMLVVQRVFFVLGLIRQAQPARGLLTETLEFCRKRMGVNLPTRLKISANATSPAVCGLVRPVILVPQDLGPSLGVGHLRPVLLHELGHIKRGDLWVNLVQTVLQIIYFYNPLLWLANAMIRRIREQAVDEMVQVAMGERAEQYPETLLSVARLAFGRPALALRFIGVVESKSQLQGRIKKMLNQPIPKRAKLGFAGLLVIICAAALLLPMAAAKEKAVDTKSAELQSSNDYFVRIYQVNRPVADFAEREDLSSPESAYAAINRVSASGDESAWAKVSVKRLAEKFAGGGKSTVDPEWAAVLLNAQILEVRIFDNTLAMVAAKLPQEFSSKPIIKPIDVRNLELENGRWLNTGNDRVNTLEEAAAIFQNHIYAYSDGRKTSQGAGTSVKLDESFLAETGALYDKINEAYKDENLLELDAAANDFSDTIRDYLSSHPEIEETDKEMYTMLHTMSEVSDDLHDAIRNEKTYYIKPTYEVLQDVCYKFDKELVERSGARSGSEETELANDDGTSAGKWSYSGGGHGVKFSAPSDGCVLKTVKLYGSRYGEYEAPDDDFDVWLCDKDFNVIANFKFPYSLFAKRGHTKWVTLDVDGVEVPKEFAICVAFDPHQTKGIYVYYDDKNSEHSYQGIPPDMEPFKDGNWMIRAIVETPSGKAASSPSPSRADRMEAENLASQAWKLWGARQLAEAEDMFKQAIEKDPTNATAWNGLGWAQQNQGKMENALYSFEKCLEIEPRHAAALNGLGWIAKSEDKTDEAIEYWKKAVRVSGGNATASLSGLAQTYMELGQYDEAVKYYQMWLKVEPNNEQAKDGLQQARAKQ